MLRIHTQSRKLSQTLIIFSRVLLLMCLTFLIAAAASLLVMRSHGERLLSVQTGSMIPAGERLLSVQTGSMIPAFRPGDAVIVQTDKMSRLRVGDIISYQSPADHSLIISHRLIRIDRQTGWLTTAGDALHSYDPTFPPRLVVGRVTAVAPRFGFLLDALRTPLGLALAVYLPATAIIIAEVRRLTRHYSSQLYRALDYT